MTQESEDALARELAALLADALKRVHELGDQDSASRIAAKAWSLLREAHPKEAQKMDGLLHLFTGVMHRR
jgi:hypothetical protein